MGKGYETAGDGGVEADPFPDIAAVPCGKRLPHAHPSRNDHPPIEMEKSLEKPAFPPFW